MHDPAHPGESLRGATAAARWTVTEASARFGCTRQTHYDLAQERLRQERAVA